MSDWQVPLLSKYSESQWELACQASPAITSYRRWLQVNPQGDFANELRIERHENWLRAALATFFDLTTTANICRFWSDCADSLLRQAWSHCGLDKDLVAIVALGKLGAQELNLSSDVDLIVVSRVGINQDIDRKLKKLSSLLSIQTALGFALRLDFDLRPGGRFSPLVCSLPQMEDYYWSQGETWERLALVRARTILGPSDLVADIHEMFSRFTYRKFLDYTLLDDLKNLRTRIHQHYRSSSPNEYHLKLGVGGIRDIELFVHALQVIHGGRDLAVRTHLTSSAIHALRHKKILPEAEADLLENSYWHFRHLEHLVQIVNDRQDHILNFNQLPSGPRMVDKDSVISLTKEVDRIVQSLLGAAESDRDTLPEGSEAQQEWLLGLGYSQAAIDSTWSDLVGTTSRSTKLERDELARKQFLFAFVLEMSRSGVDKELGLSLLLKFTQSIRAKATFFSLLAREPRIIRDLGRLFSSSPYLGSVLASRPEIIDNILFRSQTEFPADLEEALEAMAEHRLLTEIIAANQFLFDRDSSRLCRYLSNGADHIITELLYRIDDRKEAQRLDIIAMGKWGGCELGFRSDLDLIFVTTEIPTPLDHKIARRITNRLTDIHKGGRIYSVDLRLRPSGNSGPLILNLNKLQEYLRTTATPWERQAYLRSRSITGRVIDLNQICSQRGLSSEDIKELKRIRAKLIHLPTDEVTDLKLTAGGLTDTELSLQTCLLAEDINTSGPSTNAMIDSLNAAGKFNTANLEILRRNYQEIRSAEQMVQLAFNHSGSEIPRTGQESDRLATLMKFDSPKLHQRLHHLMRQSAEILIELDPIFRA